MRVGIERLTLAALSVAVLVSVLTSLPTWWGGHLGGDRLLVHMMASGVIVVTLPMYGFLRLRGLLGGVPRRRFDPVAFWLVIVFGFMTIATMFACMTPLASTASMRELIDLHGWTGGAMAVALAAGLLARLGLSKQAPVYSDSAAKSSPVE